MYFSLLFIIGVLSRRFISIRFMIYCLTSPMSGLSTSPLLKSIDVICLVFQLPDATAVSIASYLAVSSLFSSVNISPTRLFIVYMFSLMIS